MRFADQIQHKRLAFGEPIANIAAELDGDTHHRRLEAGLHHPTREHARRPRAGADRENENAARNVPNTRVERFCLLIDNTWQLIQFAPCAGCGPASVPRSRLCSSAAAVTAAKIELGRARDPIAVRGDLLDAAPHQIEHLIELALDNRAHRVQLVVEAAAVDDVDTLGHVRADAFAFAERRDRHFQKDHRA